MRLRPYPLRTPDRPWGESRSAGSLSLVAVLAGLEAADPLRRGGTGEDGHRATSGRSQTTDLRQAYGVPTQA